MSVSAPWTLKNECANPACKHEKDSHHEGKDNCLALYCDCQRFFKEGEYKPPVKRSGPPYINDVDDDAAPDTPKMPGWGPWP